MISNVRVTRLLRGKRNARKSSNTEMLSCSFLGYIIVLPGIDVNFG
jgi:hypothetical protein